MIDVGHMWRLFHGLGLFSSMTLLAGGCGVEVGNPGADEDEASIAIQLTSDNSTAGLDLVSSFSLTDSSNALPTFQDFQLGIQEIILFGENQGKNVKAVVVGLDNFVSITAEGEEFVPQFSAKNVPAGTYDVLQVRFTSTQPVVFTRPDGRRELVEVDSGFSEGFYIPVSLDFTSSESQEVVVTLDLESSLTADPNNSDRFRFKPRGSAHSPGFRVKTSGQTSLEGAVVACAYAHSLEADPRAPRSFPKGDSKPPPVSDGSGEIRPRPIFANRDEIERDETFDCPNAFARSRVRQGEYVFKNLKPGIYEIRVFSSDGSYVDVEEPLKIRPKPGRSKKQRLRQFREVPSTTDSL